MVHLSARPRPVNTHVRLQVSLRRERAAADLTFKRPFSSMRAIMHLQRALATQYALADRALIRVFQRGLHSFYKFLQFARFRLLDLHEFLH